MTIAMTNYVNTALQAYFELAKKSAIEFSSVRKEIYQTFKKIIKYMFKYLRVLLQILII